MQDKLDELAKGFGIIRRQASTPLGSILGIDWGQNKFSIKLRHKKRIVIW